MSKVDLKIAMKDSSMKDLDRTLSYVNGSLSNAALVEVAQQLVGLTTNTYVGGERVDRMDISQPAPSPAGKPEPTLTITVDESNFPLGGTYTYNGDGEIFAYATGDGSPILISVNRTAKTFATNYSGSSGDYNLDVYLCASEGTNYASKVVTAHAQHGST